MIFQSALEVFWMLLTANNVYRYVHTVRMVKLKK